jgi:TonB family protein
LFLTGTVKQRYPSNCRLLNKRNQAKFVVSPTSKQLRQNLKLGNFGSDLLSETLSAVRDDGYGRASRSLEEDAAITYLKDLVAAGNHRLDPMLAALTDTACQLTGADGAALAMWKDGAMICRARSGEIAPPLGARLSADTGISGECLRTGKVLNCADTENDSLVDAEVCRRLSLRSIVVLPIQGWRGINGILEVFSVKPATFTDQNIALLQQLAGLAERARSARPHGASSSAPRQQAVARRKPAGLPASDRIGELAKAFLGGRSKPLGFGLVLLAISLVAMSVWLGWRGAERQEERSRSRQISANLAASGASSFSDVAMQAAAGQALQEEELMIELPTGKGEASAHGSKTHDRASHAPDSDPVWQRNPGGERVYPSRPATSNTKPSPAMPLQFASKIDRIHGKPEISGGAILNRVEPIYPADALQQKVQGKVTLAATVREDGSVSKVNVIKGSPLLTQSAIDAVRQWHYEPFERNGRAVKNTISVDLDFKLPN